LTTSNREECTGAANGKNGRGKSVNVARVARMLGENVRLTGFKGGETGNWLESQLKKLGSLQDLLKYPVRQEQTTIL